MDGDAVAGIVRAVLTQDGDIKHGDSKWAPQAGGLPTSGLPVWGPRTSKYCPGWFRRPRKALGVGPLELLQKISKIFLDKIFMSPPNLLGHKCLRTVNLTYLSPTQYAFVAY